MSSALNPQVTYQPSTSSITSQSGDTRIIIVLTWSSFILSALIFILVYAGNALKQDFMRPPKNNETQIYQLYGVYSEAGTMNRKREMQTGPCADINEQKFLAYFDYELNLCSRFMGDPRYCLVGDNRFETRDDCRRACISPAFQKHRCKGVHFGFCLGSADKLYNVVFSNGQCRLTKSILCLQGDNKFLNLEECQKFCCKSCNSEHCLAKPKEGQCLSADLRYRFYYDNRTNQCLVHRGICLKGRNRYRTLETCAMHFPLKSEDRLRCVRPA